MTPWILWFLLGRLHPLLQLSQCFPLVLELLMLLLNLSILMILLLQLGQILLLFPWHLYFLLGLELQLHLYFLLGLRLPQYQLLPCFLLDRHTQLPLILLCHR